MAECGTCEFTVDTIKGADGDSPYIGENGNWWVGDTDTGVDASCCYAVSTYDAGEVGDDVELYTRDSGDTVTQLTYGPEYQIVGLRYRVQPESDGLLRVECSFNMVGLTDLDNTTIYMCDTLTSLDTHIQSTYSKTFSAPASTAYLQPLTANTSTIDLALRPLLAAYTDTTVFNGVTADRLLSIIEAGTLSDKTPNILVGFTVYLPIEDV